MIERRRYQRIGGTQPARIVFDYRRVLTCRVCDFSVAGAGLEVEPASVIPDTFDLICNHGEGHSCHLVWRRKRRAGVEFCDT